MSWRTSWRTSWRDCCIRGAARSSERGTGPRGGAALLLGLGLGGSLVAALDHGDQRELAARVDLGDLDLHLGADREHVLDVLHALATGELADLRDVQQAVLARHE